MRPSRPAWWAKMAQPHAVWPSRDDSFGWVWRREETWRRRTKGAPGTEKCRPPSVKVRPPFRRVRAITPQLNHGYRHRPSPTSTPCLPPGVCSMLHRALNIHPKPRLATRQTCWDTLPPFGWERPLQAVWAPRAASGVQRTAAQRGHVWRKPQTRHGVLDPA